MKTEKKENKVKRKRRSGVLIVLLSLLLIAGAYFLFLLAASPRNLKERIIAMIVSSFDGRVFVGKARFRLFQGITVRELYLTGQNGEPFIYIRKLVLRHNLLALLRRKLVITGAEIESPQISLRCSAEEGWNVLQLIKSEGEFDLSSAPISSLSVTGGSISLTDDSRVRRFPFMLLSNINIATKHVEHNGSTVAIDGTFDENVLGAGWQLTGKLDVPKSVAQLSFSQKGMALDERLRKKLPPVNVGPLRELQALDGIADLDFDLFYTAASRPQLRYSLRLNLEKCRTRIAGLSYPIDSLTGNLEFKDGELILRNIIAKSKNMSVIAEGTVCPEGETDVTFTAKNLPIDERLLPLLEDRWRKAMERVELLGSADATCRMTRGASEAAALNYMLKIDLKDCSATGSDLPLRVEGLGGTMTCNNHELSLANLRGETPVGPVVVRDTTLNLGLEARRHVEIELKDVAIADFLSELANRAPDVQNQVAMYNPAGAADVVCRISWESAGENMQYDVTADFRDMSMTYPGIRERFSDLTGKLKYLPDKLIIEAASGECGKNPISIRELCADLGSKEIVSGQVKMEGWAIDEDLKAFVPDDLRRVLKDLDLRGRVDVVHEVDPDPAKTQTTVVLLGCTAKYVNAAYPISDICGRVVYKGNQITFENVNGKNGEATISLATKTLNLKQKDPLQVAFSLKNLPLDSQLKSVLPLSMIPYWDQFNPSGKVNIDLFISFTPGASAQPQVTAAMDWNGSSLQYVDFPYPVSDVRGILEIWPDRIVLRNMEGKAGTGHLRFHDTVIFRDEEYGMDIKIEGSQMSLDNTLRECLRKDVQAAWDIVQPKGTFNFTWYQTKGHGKGAKPDYSLEMELTNAQMNSEYFKYPLGEMTGTILFKGNKARFRNVVGKNDKATVTLEGYATNAPDSGEDLVSLKIRAENMPLDDNLKNGLPKLYQKVWDELEPKDKENPQDRGVISFSGTIRYKEIEDGRVVVIYGLNPLTFYDCRMELGDVSLDNIKGNLRVQGEVYPGEREEWTDEKPDAPKPNSAFTGSLNLTEVTVAGKKYTELDVPEFIGKFYGDDFEFHAPWIQAYLYGGRFRGQMDIDRAEKRYGDTEIHYTAEFQVGDVNVKDLVDLAGVDVQGINGTLEAKSWVEGAGLKPEELAARGSMSINNGDMGNLPQKFGIPKKLIGNTAFTEAYMEYQIKDARAFIDKLDFKGDRLALNGKGHLRLDPKQPGELRFKHQGKGAFGKVMEEVFGPEIVVKLGGDLEGPIWKVDPLVPLRNLVRGLAHVLQIKTEPEDKW